MVNEGPGKHRDRAEPEIYVQVQRRGSFSEQKRGDGVWEGELWVTL